MSRYCPDFDQFTKLSARGNCVPVYRQLLADTLTPVLAYERVAESRHAFLLESVERGEHIARYSFIGADPYQVFTYQDGKARIEDHAGNVDEHPADDPFADPKWRPHLKPGLAQRLINGIISEPPSRRTLPSAPSAGWDARSILSSAACAAGFAPMP